MITWFRAALKSYAQSFTESEHPEDYKLVMRKDVWDKELDAEVLSVPYILLSFPLDHNQMQRKTTNGTRRIRS